MALVTWGCVYHMSWVEVRTAEEWIKQHALHSPEGHIVQDGTYNHGEQITYILNHTCVCSSSCCLCI